MLKQNSGLVDLSFNRKQKLSPRITPTGFRISFCWIKYFVELTPIKEIEVSSKAHWFITFSLAIRMATIFRLKHFSGRLNGAVY